MSKGFIVRLISYENLKMVNICDEEILGKELREGELTVNINREYFSGFLVDEKKAVQLVKEADIINLVGNRIVEAVLRERLAHPKAARKISDVAFLMIYRFMSKG